jgi:hypothetical protein
MDSMGRLRILEASQRKEFHEPTQTASDSAREPDQNAAGDDQRRPEGKPSADQLLAA